MSLLRKMWVLGVLLLGTSVVRAEHVQWRSADQADSSHPRSTNTTCTTTSLGLGRPVPLTAQPASTKTVWRKVVTPELQPCAAISNCSANHLQPTPFGMQPIFRGQDGVLPVPPPPNPGQLPPSEEPYNCAVPTDPLAPGVTGGVPLGPPPQSSIFGGFVGTMFPGAGSRGLLQSDTAFNGFSSPMTNPFYFEDPRSLTEVRVNYLYQPAPGGNLIYAGGDVQNLNIQARLALTERISVVVNRLGWLNNSPNSPGFGVNDASGFTELMLGPKIVFYRDECAQTIFSGGLTFTLPIGDGAINQDTGDLALTPYFSFGQEFLKNSWGSFHFLNSTGYQFSIGEARTEFLFSSFHLDYDVAGLGYIYPFVELNYFLYTANGSNVTSPMVNFEGRDLINFGAVNNADNHDLSIAVGSRFKIFEWLQFGGAIEFPVLDKGIMDYRATFDLIFRY